NNRTRAKRVRHLTSAPLASLGTVVSTRNNFNYAVRRESIATSRHRRRLFAFVRLPECGGGAIEGDAAGSLAASVFHLGSVVSNYCSHNGSGYAGCQQGLSGSLLRNEPTFNSGHLLSDRTKLFRASDAGRQPISPFLAFPDGV